MWNRKLERETTAYLAPCPSNHKEEAEGIHSNVPAVPATWEAQMGNRLSQS